MRIGILTGGGDVPGLNPCIKALVYRAIDEGHEVIGIRRGWFGVLNYNPELSFKDNAVNAIHLDKQAVRTVDRSGGTFLHTSRTNPSKVKAKDLPAHLKGNITDGERFDMTPHALKVVESLKLDVLVPIGGDDTQSYSERLHREGVRVIAIPKTMDNDVFGTDYCIGFSTAVSRSEQLITNMRSSVGSHERIAVIELFGRNSGETSLMAAYLASVDRALISEVPFDADKLAKLIMEDKRSNPSNYAMLTISEGAMLTGGNIVESGEEDPYGHKKLGGIGQVTTDILKKQTGQEVIYQSIGYMMRSGAPDSVDLMVGFNFANLALDLISKQIYGRMLAIKNGVYTHIPLSMVTTGIKRVNVDEFYDIEKYRPNIKNLEGKPLFLY